MVRSFKWVTALIALAALIGLMLVNGSGQATAEKWPTPGRTQPVVQVVALNATPGYHNHTFYSCTVDGRQSWVYLRYHIDASSSALDIDYLDYSSDPNFLANKFMIELEYNPGYYTPITPSGGVFGGSSTTLDDVPSEFLWYDSDYVYDVFSNTSTPLIKAWWWGVGAGAATGRCSDSVEIE